MVTLQLQKAELQGMRIKCLHLIYPSSFDNNSILDAIVDASKNTQATRLSTEAELPSCPAQGHTGTHSPFRHFRPTKLARPLWLQLNVFIMPLPCFWFLTTFYHVFWCFAVCFTVQLQVEVWVFSKLKQTNNKPKCKSSRSKEMSESKTCNEAESKVRLVLDT